jgi:histidine triad (HIT) family protein
VTARGDFDLDSYKRLSQAGCFVCRTVARDPAYRHEIVYEDAAFIAVLDRFPTLAGRILVAPTRDLEHVVGDMDPEEFGRLMALVYRVGQGVQRAVPTERLYVLALGSQQGNSHVHWHVAPLPPGIPYEEQQFHALMLEHGMVALGPKETEALATRIRSHLGAGGGEAP